MKFVSYNFFIYGKIKKKRCWSCKSLAVIKWGKQQGKQRFKCSNCGMFFTWKNEEVSRANRFRWFKDWVVGRQTLLQLCRTSGYSERTLNRYFDAYLNVPPLL